MATPTNAGTAPEGTPDFGLVAAKTTKHKNPVPNASMKIACAKFATLPERLINGGIRRKVSYENKERVLMHQANVR